MALLKSADAKLISWKPVSPKRDRQKIPRVKESIQQFPFQRIAIGDDLS